MSSSCSVFSFSAGPGVPNRNGDLPPGQIRVGRTPFPRRRAGPLYRESRGATPGSANRKPCPRRFVGVMDSIRVVQGRGASLRIWAAARGASEAGVKVPVPRYLGGAPQLRGPVQFHCGRDFARLGGSSMKFFPHLRDPRIDVWEVARKIRHLFMIMAPQAYETPYHISHGLRRIVGSIVGTRIHRPRIFAGIDSGCIRSARVQAIFEQPHSHATAESEGRHSWGGKPAW